MEKANEIVAELEKLLGVPVVFIRWPRGVKGTKRRWKHLRVADMTADYLSKLPSGNIGVALGEVSGGLCAIDVDDDHLVEPFLAANPQLRETLQTHGSRGCVFWIRFVGQYPLRTFKLKNHSGRNVGEFRSGGSQSIIWGIHPNTERPYEFVTKKPVMTMEFHSLRWPVEINNPCKTAECTESTETQRDRTNRETDVVVFLQVGVENNDSKSEIRSIEEAVQASLPSQPHENHHSLFTLARALLAFQKYRGKQGEPQPTQSLSNDCLRTAFNLWHSQALPNLRPGQTKDEYLMEFLAAWAGAKVPAEDQPIPEEKPRDCRGYPQPTVPWDQIMRKPNGRNKADEYIHSDKGETYQKARSFRKGVHSVHGPLPLAIILLGGNEDSLDLGELTSLH